MERHRLLCGACAAIVLVVSFCGCRSPKTDAPPPTIEFTRVPPHGSKEPLEGRVANVDPSKAAVAVYIFVDGWWTKPTWDAPLRGIGPDGTWSCEIATSAEDPRATRIAAFLLPSGARVPLARGEAQLPEELTDLALGKAEASRSPSAAERSITFANRRWTVKRSATPVGPGPNVFSDDAANVWVDGEGQLHLRITGGNGPWRCAEVICDDTLGYGTYTFTLAGQPDKLDPGVVLGLFTWDDAPESNHREIDIEFSRWGVADDPNAQFVVQPYDREGNRHRFEIALGGKPSAHRFEWREDRVLFSSAVSDGDGATPEPLESWTYTGPDLPAPGAEHVRINLWLLGGRPPTDGQEVEAVIRQFRFDPVAQAGR